MATSTQTPGSGPKVDKNAPKSLPLLRVPRAVVKLFVSSPETKGTATRGGSHRKKTRNLSGVKAPAPAPTAAKTTTPIETSPGRAGATNPVEPKTSAPAFSSRRPPEPKPSQPAAPNTELPDLEDKIVVLDPALTAAAEAAVASSVSEQSQAESPSVEQPSPIKMEAPASVAVEEERADEEPGSPQPEMRANDGVFAPQPPLSGGAGAEEPLVVNEPASFVDDAPGDSPVVTEGVELAHPTSEKVFEPQPMLFRSAQSKAGTTKRKRPSSLERLMRVEAEQKLSSEVLGQFIDLEGKPEEPTAAAVVKEPMDPAAEWAAAMAALTASTSVEDWIEPADLESALEDASGDVPAGVNLKPRPASEDELLGQGGWDNAATAFDEEDAPQLREDVAPDVNGTIYGELPPDYLIESDTISEEDDEEVLRTVAGLENPWMTYEEEDEEPSDFLTRQPEPDFEPDVAGTAGDASEVDLSRELEPEPEAAPVPRAKAKPEKQTETPQRKEAHESVSTSRVVTSEMSPPPLDFSGESASSAPAVEPKEAQAKWPTPEAQVSEEDSSGPASEPKPSALASVSAPPKLVLPKFRSAKSVTKDEAKAPALDSAQPVELGETAPKAESPADQPESRLAAAPAAKSDSAPPKLPTAQLEAPPKLDPQAKPAPAPKKEEPVAKAKAVPPPLPAPPSAPASTLLNEEHLPQPTQVMSLAQLPPGARTTPPPLPSAPSAPADTLPSEKHLPQPTQVMTPAQLPPGAKTTPPPLPTMKLPKPEGEEEPEATGALPPPLPTSPQEEAGATIKLPAPKAKKVVEDALPKEDTSELIPATESMVEFKTPPTSQFRVQEILRGDSPDDGGKLPPTPGSGIAEVDDTDSRGTAGTTQKLTIPLAAVAPPEPPKATPKSSDTARIELPEWFQKRDPQAGKGPEPTEPPLAHFAKSSTEDDATSKMSDTEQLPEPPYAQTKDEAKRRELELPEFATTKPKGVRPPSAARIKVQDKMAEAEAKLAQQAAKTVSLDPSFKIDNAELLKDFPVQKAPEKKEAAEEAAPALEPIEQPAEADAASPAAAKPAKPQPLKPLKMGSLKPMSREPAPLLARGRRDSSMGQVPVAEPEKEKADASSADTQQLAAKAAGSSRPGKLKSRAQGKATGAGPVRPGVPGGPKAKAGDGTAKQDRAAKQPAPRKLATQKQPHAAPLRPKEKTIVGQIVSWTLYLALLGGTVTGLGYYFIETERETRLSFQVIAPDYRIDKVAIVQNDFRPDVRDHIKFREDARLPVIAKIREVKDDISRVEADLAGRRQSIRSQKSAIEEAQAAKEKIIAESKEETRTITRGVDEQRASLQNERETKLQAFKVMIEERARRLNLSYEPGDEFESPKVWVATYRLALFDAPEGVDRAAERSWAGEELDAWTKYEADWQERISSIRVEREVIKVKPKPKIDQEEALIANLEAQIKTAEVDIQRLEKERETYVKELADLESELQTDDEPVLANIRKSPEGNLLKEIPAVKGEPGAFEMLVDATGTGMPPGEYMVWVQAFKDREEYWAFVNIDLKEFQTHLFLIRPDTFTRIRDVVNNPHNPNFLRAIPVEDSL